MSDRDDIERELLAMVHERDKWKSLAGELSEEGTYLLECMRAAHINNKSLKFAMLELEKKLDKAREAGL